MKQFLLKYKWTLLLGTLIVLSFFLLRLPNLTILPIFADEAIYIRWAQIMKAEPTLRFISLTDGKTPLFMWLMIPFFKVFSDPLFAGRLLSVLSGFMTLIGVFVLGWKFFNQRVALWAAFLLTITPLIIFFDRMALVDAMLSAFSLWSLFLALLLIKYPRVDLAMFLGYVLGGGILTKTPGLFNALALPATLLTFNWFSKNRQWKLLKTFGLLILALLIMFVLYNLLRLGPGFISLSSRNQDYIFSPLELIERPLDPFIPHFRDLADWFPKLITLPIMIAVFLGIIFAFFKRNTTALAILFWALIPMVVEMFLLRTFTARYILFSIPPLLMLGGWGIDQSLEKLKKKLIFIPVVAFILLVLPMQNNLNFLFSPEKANLPRSERSGYLENWTAGYGFSKIAQYLIEQAQNGVVVVGTEGSFGTLPDGLLIYLEKYIHSTPPSKQIIVIGGTATVSAQIRETANKHPTYYVANKSRFLGEDHMELIYEFPKAQGPKLPQDAILFYQVLPK